MSTCPSSRRLSSLNDRDCAASPGTRVCSRFPRASQRARLLMCAVEQGPSRAWAGGPALPHSAHSSTAVSSDVPSYASTTLSAEIAPLSGRRAPPENGHPGTHEWRLLDRSPQPGRLAVTLSVIHHYNILHREFLHALQKDAIKLALLLPWHSQ